MPGFRASVGDAGPYLLCRLHFPPECAPEAAPARREIRPSDREARPEQRGAREPSEIENPARPPAQYANPDLLAQHPGGGERAPFFIFIFFTS